MIVVLWLLAADPLLSEANARCDEARRQSLQMHMDMAMRGFEDAIARHTRALADGGSYDALALCLVDYGATLLDAKKVDLALEAMLKAVSLRPSLQVSPQTHTPNVVSTLASARRKLASAPLGTLTVVTTPAEVSVQIDGQVENMAPLTTTLAAGEHWLVVRKAGFESIAMTVVVTPRKVERIDLFLKATSRMPEPPQVPASQPALAPREIVVVTPAVPVAAEPHQARTPAALAWLPFGAGQFLSHRPLAGALFLASEVLLLGTTFLTYFLIAGDRQPDGSFRNLGRDRALQIVNFTAAGLLLADAIFGAVDGELNR